MTTQEQQLLQGLTDRINQTILSEKDPDAEQFIQQSLGRNPDALYILAQTVLVQQYALDQAKQQLDQAKQQLDQAKLDLDHAGQQAQQQQRQPRPATSFLGNLFGHSDTPPPPPPPPQYQPVPSYTQPQYIGQPAPQFASQFMPQQGGFLRSAMQTATGVAAGALAFEGIESLLHGFDHHAGYGMGGFDTQRPGETINNNYYGDATPHEHGPDLSDRLAASGDQPSPDIEDRRDDNTSNFADTSDDTSSDDSSSFDDSSSSTDDSSGSDFDSGGGDDFSS